MENTGQAHPGFDLEVDLMILDYLVCSAIKRMIQERIAQRSGHTGENCESLLQMVDVFLPLFESKHGKEMLPRGLSVKLHILSFGNLFLRRYNASQFLPSLQTLQRQRRTAAARGRMWQEQHQEGLRSGDSGSPDLNIPQSSLLNNRESMLAHMGISPSENVPDPDSMVSLLDALPEFMSLCYTVESNVKCRLMELAVSLMFHAALEQILICGQPAQQAVSESFAWNWTNSDTVMGTEPQAVTWITSRDSLRDKVSRASEEPNAVDMLQKLLHEHSLFTFEGSVLQGLGDLLDVLDTPILMQLEAGKLHNSTALEVDSLGELIGIF